jgi:Holliday junction resolvasome RuvABC endonuclease subunit
MPLLLIKRPVAAPPAKPAVVKPPAKQEKKDERPPFVVMGLDVSLRHTGIVFLDRDGKLLSSETFENPKIEGEDSRVGGYTPVVRHVVGLLRGVTYKPPGMKVIVAKEDYAFSQHSSSDTTLKELGGILLWEISKIVYTAFITVGITSAKKWMTGKGTADKDDMILATERRFGLRADEHVCDSIAVAATVLDSMYPGTFKTSAVKLDDASTLAKNAKALLHWIGSD